MYGTNRKMLALALALILAAGALSVPALAERYATSGSAAETTVFFVESYGNAKVTFSQEEGLCHELSATHLIDGIQGDEDEWGKYHIYIEAPGGSTQVEDWDKTFFGGSFSISISGRGTYRIKVVPYTVNEMTESWNMDVFLGWEVYPQWWVSEQKNCSVTSNVSTSVYVQKVDQDTGAVLESRSVTVNYGSNTVNAGANPTGYTLVSSATATVSVDQSGRANTSTVTFFYRRNAPSSASLTVKCYDENGSYLQSYTETVSASRNISPKSISGYSATSGSAYVTFNSSTGACNPSSLSFYYRRNAPSAAALTVYCYDENGNYIQAYTESISSGRYVSPRHLDGYTAVSGDTYVGFNAGTGTCSPSSVSFFYRANSSAPTGTIQPFPAYGYSLWLRNSNVERIRPQCGPGRNYAVFASMSGSTKLYSPRNITYLSAHFCVGDWVYVEFGYSDNVVRYGFFEKSLFEPSVSWSSIPSYSLSSEQYGTVTVSTLPYNGPGTHCGSYESCRLYQGTPVYACMECNGWYLCRFYNNHDNNYGDIYLWVPGSNISWY